jgi:hypothetical protein
MAVIAREDASAVQNRSDHRLLGGRFDSVFNAINTLAAPCRGHFFALLAYYGILCRFSGCKRRYGIGQDKLTKD